MTEHTYPPHWRPGQGDQDMDNVWRVLDRLRPGLLTEDVRAFLAGGMHAAVATARKEGCAAGMSNELQFVAPPKSQYYVYATSVGGAAAFGSTLRVKMMFVPQPSAKRSVLAHGRPQSRIWPDLTVVALKIDDYSPTVSIMPGLFRGRAEDRITLYSVCLGDRASLALKRKEIDPASAFWLTDFGDDLSGYMNYVQPLGPDHWRGHWRGPTFGECMVSPNKILDL